LDSPLSAHALWLRICGNMPYGIIICQYIYIYILEIDAQELTLKKIEFKLDENRIRKYFACAELRTWISDK
jgi:hypothetical protein